MEIKISQLTCLKCNYTWFPRSTNIPKICPKCKNYNWDRPLKRPRDNNHSH